MIRRSLLSISLITVFVGSELAADKGGNAPPDCPKGQIWSSRDNKCVEARSGLSDADLIGAGRGLAKAGSRDPYDADTSR